VNQERLWAPWRLDYVTGKESSAKPPEPSDWLADADRNCFLCRAAAEFEPPTVADQALLVVSRSEHCVVVLNRFPYNNGHVLISPRRHVAELTAMARQEHIACVEQLAQLTTIYREVLNAEGFNVGLNLGRVAGAGVPGHLHWHLVPRWAGDNNFMPAVAATRVIPQSLETLWKSLSDALKR
jgi:ATP adenylyltransferase